MRKIILLSFIFLSFFLNAHEPNYGLYFKSHKYMGAERTALVLNNNKPFRLNKEFILSFDMSLRNEFIFGTVFKIISDTQDVISLNFIADEKNNQYPILSINDNIYPITNRIELNKWFFVNIRFSAKKDSVLLDYDKIHLAIPFSFKDWREVSLYFGVCRHPNFSSAEIPPMNVRDIKIHSNNKLIRYWQLKRHTVDCCYDEIQDIPAIAVNPEWIIDNHTRWDFLYSKEFPELTNPQYAFDPQKNLIYIVPDHKTVICYNPKSGKDSIIFVKGGYPASRSTNQLIFDTVRNKLVSYNLDERTVSEFSFENECWSKETPPVKEHSFWHHTTSFYEKEHSIFAFGGYGFYLYKNDLFKISPEKAEWENDKLIVIPPRYSSASVIVDDHLYIFGGRGCKTGKQELNPHIYYDLYSVNLKTKETKLIRQFKEKRQFLPCGNMIYNSADSCFYVLTNWQKGTLFKISLNHADLQEASSPINQSAIESDYTFYTLFHSERDSKLYALFCKNFKTGSSDISIFEINYPPIAQSDIVQEVPDKSAQLICWGSYIGLGIVLLSLIAIYIYRKKKRKSRFQDMSHETDAFEQPHANKTKNNSRQCINLLGGFNIIDKEGRDITVHFTPILKNLLLLILLYSENDGKGINSKNIEAILWPDKEEKSARNNRNVSITRLKTLLSEIGNIQLYNDNRFWKLTLGEDVSCDYYRVLDQMRKIKEHPELKERLLPEVLDYLMLGPLLPHTQIDWVDKFKSDYTSLAIDFLNRLLQENDSNDVTKLQLTDVIFLYDSLNEDALTMKCYILYNSGKKGLAKNTYDNFCKEYFSLLGEKYKYSLAQILEFAEHQDKVKHT